MHVLPYFEWADGGDVPGGQPLLVAAGARVQSLSRRGTLHPRSGAPVECCRGIVASGVRFRLTRCRAARIQRSRVPAIDAAAVQGPLLDDLGVREWERLETKRA
jgi:hypothetical protein